MPQPTPIPQLLPMFGRLTAAQKLLVRTRMLQNKFEIHKSLYTRTFELMAKCEKCTRQLTALEIMERFAKNGWRDSELRCPNCRNRYEAKFLVSVNYGGTAMELKFLAPRHTEDMLPNMANMSYEEIRTQNSSLFYSALVHFGTLGNAFKEAGVAYADDPKPTDWERRVLGFLGQLPDEDVAKIIGVSKEKIAVLRKTKGVYRFVPSILLDADDVGL